MTPVISILALLAVQAANANSSAEKPKEPIYSESVVCTPQKLKALSGASIVLDLDKATKQMPAQPVQSEFEVPGGELRIMFSLRFMPAENEKPASVQLSELYLKKDGANWKMLQVFATPSVMPYPLNPLSIMVFQNPGTDEIPSYDVECRLKRERIAKDCATCR